VAIPAPPRSKRPLLAVVAVALLALIGIGFALSRRGPDTDGAHVVSPASGRPNAPLAGDPPPVPPEPPPTVPTPVVAKVTDPVGAADAAVADPTFGSAPVTTDASGKPRTNKRPKKGDKTVPVVAPIAPAAPAAPAAPTTPKPLPDDLFRDRK
jgi:protein TonB